MVGTILIAMEDAKQRRQVAKMLINEGYRIIEAETVARADDLLRRRGNIALAMMDLRGSGRREDACLALIKGVGAQVPVVVLAADEEEVALGKAMDAGARDFLLFPLTSLRLKISLSNLFQHHALAHEIRAIGRQGEEHLNFDELIAKSEAMQQLVEQAKSLAGQKSHALILTEAGCVPSLYARTLHREDPSRSGIFVSLSCAPLAGGGQEVSGDWQHRLASALTQARHGTLFLSDVHLLGEKLQQHLLEVAEKLATPQADKIGAMLDVRLVASVAADIDERVEREEFNPHLCRLLDGGRLILPPLRARQEDMIELANALLSRILAEMGQLRIRGMSEQAKALLLQYAWPGNVVELENALFRAVLLCKGNQLDVGDFPQIAKEIAISGYGMDERAFLGEDNHIRTLADIEAHVIAAALRRYRGRISEVARRLRIGRSTLYRKMEEYGLARDGDNEH